MFAVTPRTILTREDIELTDAQRQYLADALWSYLFYDPLYNRLNNELHWDKFRSELAPFEPVSKEGKLTKRVSKWVKQNFAWDLTSRCLSDIGSIVASYSANGFEYDITDTFDWQAGDYGDRGSCFWGGRSEARQIIQEAGGLAIRFYDDDGNGCGRAWLLPHGEDWLVFNAYGPALKVVSERIKLILGEEIKIKRVTMSNYGEEGGLLYINCGEAMMVSQRNISAHTHIDLSIGEDHMNTCPRCDRTTWDEEMTYIDSEDQYICGGCASEYRYCAGCDERHHEDNMEYLDLRAYQYGRWRTMDSLYCESCRDNLGQCDECGYYFEDGNGQEVNNNLVCDCCLEQNYHRCDECDEYIPNGERCECEPEQEDEEENEEPVPVQNPEQGWWIIPAGSPVPTINGVKPRNPYDLREHDCVPMIDQGWLFLARVSNVDHLLSVGYQLVPQPTAQYPGYIDNDGRWVLPRGTRLPSDTINGMRIINLSDLEQEDCWVMDWGGHVGLVWERSLYRAQLEGRTFLLPQAQHELEVA